MMLMIDRDQLCCMVLEKAKEFGYPGRKGMAQKIGLPHQSISGFLSGRKPPSPKMLAYLGLERRVMYAPKGTP